MNQHPNTTAAVTSGGLGVLVVWLLGHFGVDVSAEIGGTIAAGLAAVVLFIGRRGIRGALRAVWRGSEDPKPKAGLRTHDRRVNP